MVCPTANSQQIEWAFCRFAQSYKYKDRVYPKNTYHMGKYKCTADLLFDWLGFNQTYKADANST